MEEKHQPLLVKWGKTITKRIFANNSAVQSKIRKHLIDTINILRYEENPILYLPEKDVSAVLCLLPYVVGFTREINYVQSVQVNLSKPILIVTSNPQNMTQLVTAMCGRYDDESPFYLLSKVILTNEDIEKKALYKIFVIASREDLVAYIQSKDSYDVIVCSFNWATSIPRHTVSLVVGQDKWHLIEVFKNRVVDSALLLRGLPTQDINSDSSAEDTYIKPLRSHLTKSPSIVWERISNDFKKELAMILNRLTNAECCHIPIEINAKSEEHNKEILATLPYLIGEASNTEKSRFDLSKPVLFLTVDMLAYETITGILPKRSFQRDDSAKFNGYKWSVLFNAFDVCTFNRDISDVDVVLASLEYSNEDNVIIQNSHYKDLDKHQFSAVVVVEGKHYSTEDETRLLAQFGGLTVIFVRANMNANSSQTIKNKLSTIFTYGAECITPKLISHGGNISDKYLISNKSALSKCQQKGLCAITNWFEQTESWKKPAHVTMSIGHRYAGMVVWCLPSMLEWAENNSLIPRRACSHKKPLLILCYDEFALSHFRDLLYSNKAFHQSSIFTNIYKCSGNVDRCYFVLDENSAAKLNYDTGKYQSVVTYMECLDYLRADSFAEVIVFTDNSMSADDENIIVKKFKGLSKILFFIAKKTNASPSVTFQRHSDACANQQVAGALDVADYWSHSSSHDSCDNSQTTHEGSRLPSKMSLKDCSGIEAGGAAQVTGLRRFKELPSISSLASSSVSGRSNEERVTKVLPLIENSMEAISKDATTHEQAASASSLGDSKHEYSSTNNPLQQRTSWLRSGKNRRKHLPPLEETENVMHKIRSTKNTADYKPKIHGASGLSRSSVTASSNYSADISSIDNGNILKPRARMNLRHKRLPPLPSSSSGSRHSGIKLLKKRNKVRPLQVGSTQAIEDKSAGKKQTWAYSTRLHNVAVAKDEAAGYNISGSYNISSLRTKHNSKLTSWSEPVEYPGNACLPVKKSSVFPNEAKGTMLTRRVGGEASDYSVKPEVISDPSSVDIIRLGDAKRSASTIVLVGDLVPEDPQNAVQAKACDMLSGNEEYDDEIKGTLTIKTGGPIDPRNIYKVDVKHEAINKNSQEAMVINPFIYSPTASSLAAGPVNVSIEDKNMENPVKRLSGFSRFQSKCKKLLKSVKMSGICPPRRQIHSSSSTNQRELKIFP